MNTTLQTRPPLHQLSVCLLLGGQLGETGDTTRIADALARAFDGTRQVRVLMAVGALLGGDTTVAQAELARERVSGDADASTLVLALLDRLGGGSEAWRAPVDRVLATSSDPTLRSLAFSIETLATT